MKTVMVSGNFDPFHYIHLEYIKKASALGNLICIVSNDHQVILKKGKVNEPSCERLEILLLIFKGLGIGGEILLNVWDRDTITITEALRLIKPDILCRGSDKTIEDMPSEEKRVCDEMGIEIVHIEGRQMHGRDFI